MLSVRVRFRSTFGWWAFWGIGRSRAFLFFVATFLRLECLFLKCQNDSFQDQGSFLFIFAPTFTIKAVVFYFLEHSLSKLRKAHPPTFKKIKKRFFKMRLIFWGFFTFYLFAKTFFQKSSTSQLNLKKRSANQLPLSLKDQAHDNKIPLNQK